DPGEVWQFRATGTGRVGAYSNVGTASGTFTSGGVATTVTATDTSSYTGTDVAPLIGVVKNGPTTIAEGGGSITYAITITNNSGATDPVTVTAIGDDKLGNLLATAQAQNGNQPIVLASGASFTFTVTTNLTLNGSQPYVNVVTVTGHDDEGTSVSATATHTVTGADVAPTITIVKKSATATGRGGAPATYTFAITKKSSLNDPAPGR